jgi:hypothetical protein
MRSAECEGRRSSLKTLAEEKNATEVTGWWSRGDLNP